MAQARVGPCPPPPPHASALTPNAHPDLAKDSLPAQKRARVYTALGPGVMYFGRNCLYHRRTKWRPSRGFGHSALQDALPTPTLTSHHRSGKRLGCRNTVLVTTLGAEAPLRWPFRGPKHRCGDQLGGQNTPLVASSGGQLGCQKHTSGDQFWCPAIASGGKIPFARTRIPLWGLGP